MVLGHADKIHQETLNEFKAINKNIKIIEEYFNNVSPSYISIDTEGSEYEKATD